MGRRSLCKTGLGNSLGELCTLVSTSCLFSRNCWSKSKTVSVEGQCSALVAVRMGWQGMSRVEASLLQKQLSSCFIT